MARLINNIEDLKQHIAVSASFDFKKVLPYVVRVERKLARELIGEDQYDQFVIHEYDPDADDPIGIAKNLFCEAVSHLALYLAMPTVNMLVTNSGLKTSENSNTKDADWKDKRDFNRSLLKTYNEAIDSAFEVMEDNIDDFPDWRDSRFYTIFNRLVVRDTRTFQESFDIQKNRLTFLALKPYISEVEEQYLQAMLGDETLALLKSTSSDDFVVRAQELAQKAAVSLSVAKACEAGGVFLFSETSMTVSSDSLPWENKQVLSPESLCGLRKSRQLAGEEYLKKLKKLVVSNPEKFPDYVDRSEVGLEKKIIKTKSSLFL